MRPNTRPTLIHTIGHESNGCPLPRTTEAKQCYHCQGLGHVQADCPTLRLSGAGTSGRCYNCGQPGHLAVCLDILWYIWGICADGYSVHAQALRLQVVQCQVLVVVLALLLAVVLEAVSLPAVVSRVEPAPLHATSAEDQTILLEIARLRPWSAMPVESSVTSLGIVLPDTWKIATN